MKENSLKSRSNPSVSYLLNIDLFIKSFFGGLDCNFSHQFKCGTKMSYFPYKGIMDRELLDKHFYDDPVKISLYDMKKGWKVSRDWAGDSWKGSLGVVSSFKEKVKWVCFDLDEEAIVKKAKSGLLPKLDELGIQFIEELGGDNGERRHIWIKLDNVKQLEAKKFFTLLLRETYGYEDHLAPFADGEFDEVFGVNKPSNLIRLPLGYHLKRDSRFPLKLKNGDLTDDPGDFVEAWVNMKTLTQERMTELISTFKVIDNVKPRPRGEKKAFSFFPRNLHVPIDRVPDYLTPVFENCQAANGVLTDIVTNKMIEQRGEVHHSAGLFMAGLAAFSDAKSIEIKRFPNYTKAEKWFQKLVDTFRLRDEESHSWFSSFSTAKQGNSNRVFASCQKWEEKFDKCEGCPFKGQIETPKQFIWGTSINRKFVRPVTLTTAEQIRQTTFKTVRERINYLLEDNQQEDMLLASPQGTGKSHFSDSVACDLSKRGFKILIAVPSVTLALEHKKRLADCGVDSFVLSSHKAIFTQDISKFECPDFEEMQRKINLGVQTSHVKGEHCNKCPFYDECFYPQQYQQVQADEHKIVIIQHAHFSATEVMYDLMKKKFDVLFIDETFIDSCYDVIPVKKWEVDTFHEFKEFKWCEELYAWMNSGFPGTKKLDPPEDELASLHRYYQACNAIWRVPEFIRHYNQKRTVQPDIGIEVVYTIPNIPIRVFTDATPPIELIKKVTGITNLVSYGRGETIDYQLSHPEHRILQVLNYTASVSGLKKDKRMFEDILMKIGELVELKYTNHKVLITCYKSMKPVIEEFFANHCGEFPTAMNRITIDWMTKGTNKYEDFDVQFMLAAHYYSAAQYLLDEYKYKFVANHYVTKSGEGEFHDNPYPIPEVLASDTFVDDKRIPIQRVERSHMRGTCLYEYPNYEVSTPADPWHNLIWQYNNSNTQQAIRLRFKEDKPKIAYLLTNVYLPGFLITDTIRIEEFIQPLEKPQLLY